MKVLLDADGRRERVVGALVGSVIGDALGAPFEFGPPNAFTARFPRTVLASPNEMCGGQGWKPGEWTDDTQMALLIAASLLINDKLDEADLFCRFVKWVQADPPDVGIQTRHILTSDAGWRDAARQHFEAGHPAAGNGSLMRTTPAAIFFSRCASRVTADAARRISALTHGDPAAGDGCAIYHQLIAAALDGHNPLDRISTALADVLEPRRAKWETVLAPGWNPAHATESNGAVWPTLGSAVWALRRGTSFEATMRAVIDLGGDTDTVAAVTGGLVGAVYGMEAIPSRWMSALNGSLPGHPSLATDLATLQEIASRLDGGLRAPAQAPSLA